MILGTKLGRWSGISSQTTQPLVLLHAYARVRENKFLPQGVLPQLLCGRVASGGSWQSPRFPHEILTGLQIKELCNSVTRNVMQSEGCLEVFQNTEFSTIKKSKREDTGQAVLTSSPTLQADSCCWGVFHTISLICSIMKEQLPHTSNAHMAQEVTEVTLRLPAEFCHDRGTSWIIIAVIFIFYL